MSTQDPHDQPKGPQAPAVEPGTTPRAVHSDPVPAAGDQPADPSQEADVWTGRTHWKYYAGRLLLWALVCVLLAVALGWLHGSTNWLSVWDALKWFFIIGIVSGLIVVGTVAIRVWTCRYRLTSQRLFIERGLLSKTVDQTELIRVDDVRLYRSLLNRIFGVGTVVAVTTDATDREVTLPGILEADVVAEAIRRNMRVQRRKSLYVENI